MARIRIIIGLSLAILFLAACGGGSQLTYKITGSAAEAAVSYTDNNGETIEETVSLPWEISYKFSGAFDFELVVNNADEDGTVVCEVWADERPIGSVQGNQFAECAGSITITRRGSRTETSSNFRRRSDGGTETVSALPTKDGEALIATAIANLEVNQTETPTAVPPTETPSPTTAPTPEAVFSETNGRFAFDADLEGSYNIYTVNGDGSDLRQITFHQAKDADPSWSPDGLEIVFVSERDGVRNLYVVGADGLNLRQLTANPESDQSSDWSPAGNQIAFVTLGESSPDIFVINSDGSGQTNLTNHPANDLSPAWSPDGSQIIFVSDRDGRNQPYLMNADGSNQSRLADVAGEVMFAAWSPQDDWIALTVVDGSEIDIYIIKSDGSSLTRVTENPEFDAMPVWVETSNATSIAFVSTRGGNGELYLIDAQRNVQQITDLGVTVGFPDWTAAAASASQVDFESYTTGDGALTYRYPSDWLVGETPRENYISVSFVSDAAVLQDEDFSRPLAFMLGEVWLTETFGENDPAALHENYTQGMDQIFSLAAVSEPEMVSHSGAVEITQPFTGSAADGTTLYFTLKTVVVNGRFTVIAIGVTESGRDAYAAIVAAILDSVELQPLPLSTAEIDFTDPTTVLEAVFAAARDENFSYMADLCDPLGMNDRDTGDLCAIQPDHELKESFVQLFANGRVVGEVEYIEGSSDTFARVNFLYGPNGDLTETMELILRDGL